MENGSTFILAMSLNILFLIMLVKFFSDWVHLKYKNKMFTQLMEKIRSQEDLIEVLSSENSSEFLSNMLIKEAQGKQKILTAYSRSIVIFTLGLGLLLSGRLFPDFGEEFSIFGILAVAVGFGYLVSNIFSHQMSKKWGLLE